ncbi:hypothetical protein ACJJTC_017091 [Scirpophaga incertulas]
MKTTKSPDNAEVTPSKKKLKQARLPFKLISEVSPSPVTPPTRKRKLSVAEADIASKVGKLSKENDITEDSIVISDEETDDKTKKKTPLNPYVKLVDNVMKKKLQKSKKKKHDRKFSSTTSVTVDSSNEMKPENVELMDVDVTPVSNENKMCKVTSDVTSVQDNSELSPKDNKQRKVLKRKTNKQPAIQKTILNNDEQAQIESDLTILEDSQNIPDSKDISNTHVNEQNINEKMTDTFEMRDSIKSKNSIEIENSSIKTPTVKDNQAIEMPTLISEEEGTNEATTPKRSTRNKALNNSNIKHNESAISNPLTPKHDKSLSTTNSLDDSMTEITPANLTPKQLEKQEQELKKKKAAEAFVNFFVPKQKSEKDLTTSSPVSKSSVLSSFAIKSDMRLAPTVRVDLTEEKKHTLDKLMEAQNDNDLYLKKIKEGSAKPVVSGKTWPLSDKNEEDDVMIIEDELPPPDVTGETITCNSVVREKLRPKLLSFHDNRRPPYWGTFRKKSTSIKPRRPFGQDEKQLDYEVDSDEEWEEEQEGESIDGSAAGSEDEQGPNEYEVDNEVFVPHGYLSDEEATMDDDDVLSLSPDAQKTRLKHLEDEFESEMKKPMEKLKPRLYGILWETPEGGKPENCVDALWNYFQKWSMIMANPTPLFQPSKEPEEVEKKKVKKKKITTATNEGENQSVNTEKKKKSKPENKELKPKISKNEVKSKTPEAKKNQPGINTFLKKMKSS